MRLIRFGLKFVPIMTKAEQEAYRARYPKEAAEIDAMLTKLKDQFPTRQKLTK